MDKLEFTIPQELDGITVQAFLRQHAGLSWRMVVRLKHTEGGISVGGELRRTIDKLRAGEVLLLRFPEEQVKIEGADIPLDVVFEDEHLLVINKPAYLAVHPSAGKPEPTLANAVVRYFETKGETHSFRPVNRLDRNTSGLLLAAKTPHIAFALSGKCLKKYYALVLGKLEGEGVVDQPIRIKEGCCITREVGDGGKDSVTHWKSLKSDEDVSLIELNLETGRTHQIRVHMSWLGYPLAGDTMYGTDQEVMQRHGLHCHYMEFVHPISGEHLQFEAPIPEDMQSVLRKYFDN